MIDCLGNRAMLEAMEDKVRYRGTDGEMIFIKHLLNAHSMQGTVLGAKTKAHLNISKTGSCLQVFIIKYRK